jgi:CubicO group peptidase (beta-lactamase class C family)
LKYRLVQLLAITTILASCRQNPSASAIANKANGAPMVIQVSQHADAVTTEKYSSAINTFFEKNFGSRGFNGAYLIAKDGEIIAEKYMGYRDPILKTSQLGEHDAFHLASISKTFTGMAVLKLWQDGKLKLDDDLSLYFDKFPYPGTTIKMLLSHRSGLPNYTNFLEAYKWDKKQYVTNLDVLSCLYKYHPPLQFPTGTRFTYCNTNFALLALVVEKVTGKPFHNYLEETFFKPLQMNDTYVFSQADYERSMPSFEWNNRKYGLEFMDLVYGDKNVYSTVRDMLKWDQAMYNGKIFTDSTLMAAFTGYSYEKAGHRNYGLGWRLTEVDNGKKIVYHNGWWHGNNTVFIRMPEEKATIILLGNKYNRCIYKAKQLCDLFGEYKQSNNLFQDAETEGVNNMATGGSQ